MKLLDADLELGQAPFADPDNSAGQGDVAALAGLLGLAGREDVCPGGLEHRQQELVGLEYTNVAVTCYFS